MRYLFNRNGHAVVLVMMILMLTIMLGTAALAITGTDRLMAQRLKNQTQAYYIAEAGVERILATPHFLNSLNVDYYDDLEKDFNNSTVYLDDFEMAGGFVTVSAVKKPEGCYFIYSTGRYKDSIRILKVEVYIPITFSSKELIHPIVPDKRSRFKQWFYDNADERYIGDYTFTASTTASLEGIHYVDGNVNISGAYSNGAIIFSTGSITVLGRLEKQGLSPLILVSLEGAIISTEQPENIEGLFYCTGVIDISGFSLVKGALVGEEINIGETAGFEHSVDLVNSQSPGLVGPVEIKSWQEKYPAF